MRWKRGGLTLQKTMGRGSRGARQKNSFCSFFSENTLLACCTSNRCNNCDPNCLYTMCSPRQVLDRHPRALLLHVALRREGDDDKIHPPRL